MTPPTRWRDDPRASSSVRELLRTGLASKRLPGDVKQRSAARVNRLMVVPAAAGVLFWIKGVAIASLCVVSTVAVVHRMTRADVTKRVEPSAMKAKTTALGGQRIHAPEPPATKLPELVDADQGLVASTPPPDALAKAIRPATAPPLAPTVLQRAHAASLTAEPRVEPPPPQPIDSLAREAAMLEESRAMLDSNPNGALAELDRYAERFPEGRLTLESGLLALEALKRLGRIEEAHARGAALLEQARGSLYEARIRSLMSE